MPQPQVKTGLIQSVTPFCTNTSYETDGDGTETKGGDIRKGLVDVDSPQALSAAPAAWLTATAYAVGDTRTETAIKYECMTAHTSGVFATDLTAGKWRLANYSGNHAFGVMASDSALDG